MRITTWNINSLRPRLVQVLRLLDVVAPDVLCLQEIKAEVMILILYWKQQICLKARARLYSFL